MSISYVHRWETPFLIVKGVNNTLSFDIYSSAGAQQTASVGTIEIRRGSTEVVAASTAMTGLGPPATYTLTAATTSGLTVDVDERWRIIATLTIGGTAYDFADRPGFLVDYDMWPQIIDTDLTDAEPELNRFTGTTLTSFETARADAWATMWRDVYARDLHPHQVTDGGWTRRLHIRRTIADLYQRAASALNDESFQRKADRWEGLYMDALNERVDYDADADSYADDKSARATAPAFDPWGERPRVG